MPGDGAEMHVAATSGAAASPGHGLRHKGRRQDPNQRSRHDRTTASLAAAAAAAAAAATTSNQN